MAHDRFRTRNTRSRGRITAGILTVILALSAAGCAEFLGGAVGAVVGAIVGEEVGSAAAGGTTTLIDPPDESETVPSIYLAGPVPGWEREQLRSTPSAALPELFETSLFGGACPGLNIIAGVESDPFSEGTPARFDLFEMAPSHTADVNYYSFGEVALAGAGAPAASWQLIGVYGRSMGACAFVGVSLFTIGPRPVQRIVLR